MKDPVVGKRPLLRPLIFQIALTLLGPLQSQAKEIQVADAEALSEALAHATPGDTLLLAPGDYGAVTMKGGGGSEGRPVILRSVDPNRPASIASLDLDGVAHIAFEDMTFDYHYSPGDPSYLRVFRATKSHDIAFRRLLVDGDVARGLSSVENNYGFAYAFGIDTSSAILIEDCEIRTFLRGIIIGQSRDVIVRNNEVHDLRSDGMDFAEVSNVTISHNYIHNFRTSPKSEDHADMIQFWTSGTEAPSENIRINDNVLSSGDGPETQSIFMRNERVDTGDAGYEMFYRDIVISENVIINAHVHGITVGETDGLAISNNTLIQNLESLEHPGPDLVWVPAINVAEASKSVRVERNVTGRISGWNEQADWVVAGNFLIQNRTRAESGFYGTVFSGTLSGDPGSIATYSYRPNGPLDGAGIGATRLQGGPAALPGPRNKLRH